MDLLTVLEKTVSPDRAELEAAQQFLEQASQQNLPELLKQLSDVLKHGGNSPVARMQAALQLKNALYSKDNAIRVQYQQRWQAFPEEIRVHIKKNVLETLGTETTRPSSAAQCVAYIACAELPLGHWPELIGSLTQNVTSPSSTVILKEATLEAIGYICQDIDPEILQTQSNSILTAIVHGMQKEETSDHVRLAATNALLNSLEFTKANFDIESERHFIMQVVCEATQSANTQVRVAALQCLVKIMSLYYVYMEHYMGPALFAITMESMKSDIYEVALQGIEFWSSVCDEEVDLAIECSESQEQGRPPERTSRYYAKGALQYLVPILTVCLTKQDEFDDDDEWNPCKAAGVCLMLLATTCEDDVVPHVLPFVKDHIKNPDWKFRDAAVMAFGSILEGPDTEQLKPLVDQAMSMLIELLKDPSVVVRDTTAWTVGRVCELIPAAVLNEHNLPLLLQALVEGLTAEPRVASNVCWAFSSLAEAAYEASEVSDDQPDPLTYCLSSYFSGIVEKLLETTDRADGSQNNLRSAAYEAVMELVKNSPKDCYATVQKTTLIILERLQNVLQMEGHIQSTSDRVQFNDLQSLLCATLQSVLRKVTPENFIKYMESFKPFLTIGLKNIAEYQVCIAAVGVTGDICRALGQQVLQFCDELMMVLLEDLGDENVFKKYLEVVLNTLVEASQAQVDKSDYDMVDYLNELREGCLEAYTGIVQGLKGDADAPNVVDIQLLLPYVPYMLQFVEHVGADEDSSDAVVAAGCGLIGDLVSAFGADIFQYVDKAPISALLTRGRRSKITKTKTLATWSTKEIRKLKNASS